MKKKLTVTIGIPAYNEEKNILTLLRCLLRQSKRYFTLEKIVVVSDGSKDATTTLAKSLKSKFIKVIEHKHRAGQQAAQNVLLAVNKSDILVLIEADTLPLDNNVLDTLVRPFTSMDHLKKPLGMVIGVSVPMKPRNFYEAILVFSSTIKNGVICNIKNGNNIFVHSGHSMKALSKNFCAKLIYPADVPEDAFTYLRLKELGFSFALKKQAKVGMRHVATISDRLRQVRKYRAGRVALEKYFSKSSLQAEYYIPRKLVLAVLLRSLIANPFLTILYALELALNRLLTMRDDTFNILYTPYTSSKQLIYEG